MHMYMYMYTEINTLIWNGRPEKLAVVVPSSLHLNLRCYNLVHPVLSKTVDILYLKTTLQQVLVFDLGY